MHDVLGHGGHGNRFDVIGQENAYREHARLFSPLARRVLATETRGQNFWGSYGPHLRRPDGSVPQRGDPDFTPPGQRPFAAQKPVLMPEELASPSTGGAVPEADLETLVARINAELVSDRTGLVQNMRLGDLIGLPYHAVSIPGRSQLVEGHATKREIETFVRQHADLLSDDRNSVGVVFDRERNSTLLEVMTTVPDRDEAIALAERYGRESILDLETLEKAAVPGAGAAPSPPPGVVEDISQSLEPRTSEAAPGAKLATEAAEPGRLAGAEVRGTALSVAAPILAAQAFSEKNDYNGYGAELAAVGVIAGKKGRLLRKFTPDRDTYFMAKKTPFGVDNAGTTYEFETPKGNIEVVVSLIGDKLRIHWFGRPEGGISQKVDLGVEGTRHILAQVVREFPEAKVMTAHRITGAHAKGGEITVKKDLTRLREAGLLGAAGVLAAEYADEDAEAAALAASLPFLGRPRFYSRLQAVIERGPDKTTGKKWLDLVRQNAHKAERRWTVIEDWLKARGNQSLTRDEVLEAVGKRGLRIAEVVRGHDPRSTSATVALSRQAEQLEDGILRQTLKDAGLGDDDIGLVLDVLRSGRVDRASADNLVLMVQGLARSTEDPEALASKVRAAVDQWGEAKSLRTAIQALKQSGPRHSGLTEPGGESYREILLVLDNDPGLSALRSEREHALDALLQDPSSATAKQYTTAWAKLDAHEATVQGFRRPEHFAEPNIVVHGRVNVRTLPNGERVLFVEEIQSDWAQRGRRFGFESDPMPQLTPQRFDDGWYAVTPDGKPRGDRFESQAEVIEWIQSGAGRVPDMPFRETNEWLGLAVKRLIDEAADGGYDRIAWTTGALQGARYNLSERVAVVRWSRSDDGNFNLEIRTAGKPDDGASEPEAPKVLARRISPGALADYLGSDLARRVLGGGSKGELIDPQLHVGGEGMKVFYDRMVPDWITAYARKNDVDIPVERIDIENPGDEAPFEVPSIRVSGGIGRKLAEEGFPILGMTGIAAGALAADEAEDTDAIKAAAFGLLGRKAVKYVDPVSKILSRVDRGGIPNLEPKHRLEKAYTYWLDHLYPIKKATHEVAETVGERRLEFDAELLARAAQGDHGYAAEVLARGVHAPATLIRRTRGLEAIYTEAGERQNDLTAYRIAKRALELMDENRPGGAKVTGYEGMEDQLKAVVQKFDKDPLITRLHREIKDYHKQWLILLEEEGVLRSLTKEERKAGFSSMADLIESRGNQEYTPFFRSKKQAEHLLGPAKGGKRLANLPGPVRRLLGSQSPLIDPAESDIRLTFVYSTLVMRQRVANSLADIAENVPNQTWVTRIHAPMQRVQFNKDQLKGQVDDHLLEHIEPEHLSVFSRRPLTQRDQIIAVNGPDGKKRYYKVDPTLYEALMALSSYQATMAVRLLSLPAQFLRTGVTITPDFAVANFVRDALQTAITSDAKGSPPTALVRAVNDGLRGMATLMVAKNPGVVKRTAKAAAFGGAFGALSTTEPEDRGPGAAVGAAIAGGYGAGARLFARGGRLLGKKGVTETMKPEDIISLWRSSGGDHAAYLSMDRRTIREAIRKMQREGKSFPFAWTPMDAIRGIAHGARDLGETFENATRVGEFMAQLDKAGKTDPLTATSSAVFSRDVSTDFKRHGAGILVEILRPMAAFWNARIQGLDKIRRQARVNPKRVFPTLFLTVTAPSMALYTLNTKLAEESPEKWDYWDRPMWERNMFWLVPLPDGGFLRVPKPFELGLLFGSLPERMVEAFDPRNPHRGGMAEIGAEAWENFASLLSETFLPIPTVATPWIENFVNFDFFTGRNIHSPYEAKELDERFKGRERSSEVAGRLADLQGAMTDVASRKAPVLTSFAKFLQMSPAEIDNVFRDYTGSLGREVIHGTDRLLRDESRGEPPTLQRGQRPLTGRFFADQPRPYGEHVNQFYDAKAKAEGAKATFDQLIEMGRIEQAEAFLAGKAGEMAAAGIGQDVAKQFAAMRELRKMVEDDPDMTPDQKRMDLDEINQMMSNLAREVAAMMREVRQGQQR